MNAAGNAAVLLSDSESETRDYLERQLVTDGFEVLNARFGGEALDLAERRLPDLVLVSELDLCARLRAGEPGRTWNREVPVIVLGPERADAVDRVRAFQRGADDYVHRPIVYEELLARIRAVLRRMAPPNGDRLEAGNLVVDRATRRVTVGGEDVAARRQGVRAPLPAGERAEARVHEGRAPPRRLGLQDALPDENARLARLPPALEAPVRPRRPLRRQRLGRRLPPASTRAARLPAGAAAPSGRARPRSP